MCLNILIGIFSNSLSCHRWRCRRWLDDKRTKRRTGYENDVRCIRDCSFRNVHTTWFWVEDSVSIGSIGSSSSSSSDNWHQQLRLHSSSRASYKTITTTTTRKAHFRRRRSWFRHISTISPSSINYYSLLSEKENKKGETDAIRRHWQAVRRTDKTKDDVSSVVSMYYFLPFPYFGDFPFIAIATLLLCCWWQSSAKWRWWCCDGFAVVNDSVDCRWTAPQHGRCEALRQLPMTKNVTYVQLLLLARHHPLFQRSRGYKSVFVGVLRLYVSLRTSKLSTNIASLALLMMS